MTDWPHESVETGGVIDRAASLPTVSPSPNRVPSDEARDASTVDNAAVKNLRASHENTLAKAEALLRRGEVSECAGALQNIRPEALSGKSLDRYNYLILATAIFDADTQAAALEILNSPQVHAAPALGYRFALQNGRTRRAKDIRMAHPTLHAEFGWSASLRRLWDGRITHGLSLYPHRHGAVNFGSFVPEGAVYRPYREDADEGADAMFVEQGVGDALLHLALMKDIRDKPPRLIVGPSQLGRFIRRYFPEAEYRKSGVCYTDLRGAPMHASGDYLAIAHRRMGAFKPRPFIAGPRRALFPRFGVCWRGGSAQNRREQRRFSLDHFLDLLPHGPSYVALQADLSDEELAKLQQSDRIQAPDFDIRQDIDALLNMISGLAGVISVDSANLHLAGLADVPIYALMNTKSHWFWGRGGKVEDVYPSATTVPRHAATRLDLDRWIQRCEADFAIGLPALPKKASAAGPVFITGAPRSGTSMISNCLHAAGLWMGSTIPANRDNARGFFENREIRERILKPSLARVGADPLGVHRLPDLGRLAPDPKLRERVEHILSLQGHNRETRWGYKEPKLSLCWPAWAEAFPDATWVFVERDVEAIVASCLNTGFMRRHSRDAEFWRSFVSRYRERLRLMESTLPSVLRISADRVIGGDTTALKRLAKRLNLNWSKACDAQIDPALFNRFK